MYLPVRRHFYISFLPMWRYFFAYVALFSLIMFQHPFYLCGNMLFTYVATCFPLMWRHAIYSCVEILFNMYLSVCDDIAWCLCGALPIAYGCKIHLTYVATSPLNHVATSSLSYLAKLPFHIWRPYALHLWRICVFGLHFDRQHRAYRTHLQQ